MIYLSHTASLQCTWKYNPQIQTHSPWSKTINTPKCCVCLWPHTEDLTKYPPSIYYKIFTHRPIVDMCANSPRDYTKPTYKQLLPEAIHGKIWKDDHSGWYKRVENNGWRLLSIRFWRTIDPVTDEDNTKKKEFHYSKLKRKQDIDQRRKRRKIEWMTKMYYAGSLRVKTEDPTTAILIQRSAEGIVNAVEKGGTDNVMEWEVDELLEWTNALNFEEYISQWKEIATSNSSANYQGKWRQL
uniref:Chromosome 11 open reading frame 65 n=1 Tax=Gopherus evgoodei TaxID=1825980 RepID=A0A8C4WQQ4_9SAUR